MAEGFKEDCNNNDMPDDCETAWQFGLVGTYFDGLNLSDKPRARLDSAVTFSWSRPPWTVFGPNGLSVRWTGRILTTGVVGSYVFYVTAQDGVRLWVNGFLIINEWRNHPAVQEFPGGIWLDANREYAIVLEYYDREYPAMARLSWRPPGLAKEVIPGTNLAMGGDCNGNDSPDTCDIDLGVSNDCNFNLRPDECETDCNHNRLEDSCDIASGHSEDCNGNGIPDECDGETGVAQDCNGNGLLDECEMDIPGVPDCNHNGRPDSCDTRVSGGLWGAYFENVDFTGMPLGRVDPLVYFHWNGPPWYGFGLDTFSVRWTGRLRNLPASGNYTFYTNTDSRVSLTVDGQLIINWQSTQPPPEQSGPIALDANREHTIVMEYSHITGPAFAELWWQPPGGAKVIIPTTNLMAGGDCNNNGIPDDCDLVQHPEWDANHNGVLDTCESQDCNQNGIPDYRDIENCDGSAWCKDCNGNGMPDGCEAELLRVDDFALDSPLVPQRYIRSQRQMRHVWSWTPMLWSFCRVVLRWAR